MKRSPHENLIIAIIHRGVVDYLFPPAGMLPIDRASAVQFVEGPGLSEMSDLIGLGGLRARVLQIKANPKALKAFKSRMRKSRRQKMKKGG